MELRDLRAFAAVLELRGMTRAARRLHVVQSAVSQAVKRLEQEYGLQLLERRSDGVYPTPAGEELGRHAQRILDGVARLEEDMASYRGHAKGVVNLGVVSSLAARLATPLVRAVDDQLPDVTLRIKEGVAGELLEWLRLGRLDLVAVVSPVDAEDMTLVPTGELTLCVILQPDHRLADRSEIAFSEVADEPWISFPKSNPARRWLDDNGRDQPLDRDRRLVHVPDDVLEVEAGVARVRVLVGRVEHHGQAEDRVERDAGALGDPAQLVERGRRPALGGPELRRCAPGRRRSRASLAGELEPFCDGVSKGLSVCSPALTCSSGDVEQGKLGRVEHRYAELPEVAARRPAAITARRMPS
jgi:DNA-binding transcriptional LysR family regulator